MEQEIKFDPVSGNEVPPGATPNEVRDDIDAKLSENEYVLPANVVKYYGLKFIEGMVEKANKGWEEMEAKGRVGGKPQDPEGLSDEDRAMLEEVMSEGEPTGFAEGGFSSKGYNFKEVPAKPDFLQGANPVDPSGGTAGTGVETKTFYGPGGAVRYIMFVNGSPINAIPEGFTEKKPEETVAEKTDEQEQYLKDTKDGGWRERLEEEANRASTKKDYASMSDEDLMNNGLQSLQFGSMVEKGLGGILGGVLGGGLLGGLGGPVGAKVGQTAADQYLGFGTQEAVTSAYGLIERGNVESANTVLDAIVESTRFKSHDEIKASKYWKNASEMDTSLLRSSDKSPKDSNPAGLIRSGGGARDPYSDGSAASRSVETGGGKGSETSTTGKSAMDKPAVQEAVSKGTVSKETAENLSGQQVSNPGGFDKEEEKWGTGPMNKGGLVVRKGPKPKGQTTTKRKGLASKKRT